MKISAIVAMTRNRVIGKNNQLPWKLPDDLKRFRQLTTGHPVIMGRNTFESIGRVLPNRCNLIVSRRENYQIPGAVTCTSLEKAIQYCMDQKPDGYEETFVIGGSQIYQMALPYLDRIYLTLIHQDLEGDAIFPFIPEEDYQETDREDRESPFPYSFLTLERNKPRNFLANQTQDRYI